MSGVDGHLGVKGSLKPRVIRANPSRWERFLMKLRSVFG
jgi:hypothetical protein